MPTIPIYSTSPINACKAGGGLAPQPPHERPSHSTAALGRPKATPTRPPLGTSAGSPPLPAVAPVPIACSTAWPPVKTTTTTTSLPLPPALGPALAVSPQQSSRTMPFQFPHPPQLGIPPLAASCPAHQRSTLATTIPGVADPSCRVIQISQNPNIPGPSFNHPPGYQQNTRASDFSSYDSAAYNALRRSDEFEYDDEEGWWATAKKLAVGAGGKLSAAESEVWRRINKG